MTAPPPARPGVATWAALLVVYLVWGSTYLAIRVPSQLSGDGQRQVPGQRG